MATVATILIALPIAVMALGSTWPPQPPREVSARVDEWLREEPHMRRETAVQLARAIEMEPAIRARADVQLAMAALLRSEGQRLRLSSSRESDGAPGAHQEHGEFYGLTLMPAALRLLEQVSPEAEQVVLSAMADASYNPGSKFARALAQQGEPVVTIAVELSHDPDEMRRWRGCDILGEMLRLQKTGQLKHALSVASSAAARRALAAALQDTSVAVRRGAIRSVSAAGDREFVPLLRAMAASDPDGESGSSRVSVRRLALEAIGVIEQRQP
jgi:hypothetical protein